MAKRFHRITIKDTVTNKQKSVRIPYYVIDYCAGQIAKKDDIPFSMTQKSQIEQAKIYFREFLDSEWFSSDNDASEYVACALLRDLSIIYDKK